MEVGTDCHLMYKQRKELLLIQRNNRNEGTLFCTVDREAARLPGKQPLLLLFPGEGKIYVQTAASLGMRLAVSQTQGWLLASPPSSSQVSVGRQECPVHPGHLG